MLRRAIEAARLFWKTPIDKIAEADAREALWIAIFSCQLLVHPKILLGFCWHIPRSVSDSPVAISRSEIRIQLYGSVIIFDGPFRLAQFVISKAPAVIGINIIWIQFYGPVKIPDRLFMVATCVISISPVDIATRFLWIQLYKFIIVLDRLRKAAHGVVSISPVVIRHSKVGIQLQGPR